MRISARSRRVTDAAKAPLLRPSVRSILADRRDDRDRRSCRRRSRSRHSIHASRRFRRTSGLEVDRAEDPARGQILGPAGPETGPGKDRNRGQDGPIGRATGRETIAMTIVMAGTGTTAVLVLVRVLVIRTISTATTPTSRTTAGGRVGSRTGNRTGIGCGSTCSGTTAATRTPSTPSGRATSTCVRSLLATGGAK